MKGSSRKIDYIYVNERETDEKMRLQGGDAVKVDRFIYSCGVPSKARDNAQEK